MPVTLMLFLFPAQVLADDPEAQKSYYDANEVLIGGDNNEFIVGEGESIRISAGQSVRLLPGTHLVAGVQVVIEAGVEIPKAEEARECSSVLRNPEFLISELSLTSGSNFSSLPESKSAIGISPGMAAIAPLNSGSGSNHSIKLRNTGSPFIEVLVTAISRHIFTPDLTWGSRPENIKVMRT